MFKTFKTGGVTTTIEISEEGKVTYAVGKKKTTFDLNECDSCFWYNENRAFRNLKNPA